MYHCRTASENARQGRRHKQAPTGTRKDIQAFKLSRLRDRSTDSKVVNHWQGNEVLKIQRELQKDIQEFKLSCLQDDDANSDMSNTWTGNEAPHMIAVPDRGIQEHSRGTKRQVKNAILWKRVNLGSACHTPWLPSKASGSNSALIITAGPCTPPTSAESDQTQMGIKGLHTKGRKRITTSDRASQHGGIYTGYSSPPWLGL